MKRLTKYELPVIAHLYYSYDVISYVHDKRTCINITYRTLIYLTILTSTLNRENDICVGSDVNQGKLTIFKRILNYKYMIRIYKYIIKYTYTHP